MQSDSSVLLDILGNENRRKIISLLANRPCYVSEISGKLGLAPKVVLSHLGLLENAGIVESCVESNQRRKYFSITTSAHLEIAVSPHTYVVRMTKIPLYEEHLPPNEYAVSDPGNKNVSIVSESATAYLISRGSGIRSFGRASGFINTKNPENEYEVPKASIGSNSNAAGIPETSETTSEETAGILRIRRICKNLEIIRNKQAELSKLQEQLHIQQEYIMNDFDNAAAEISADDLDMDILSLLVQKDMSAAYLCHHLGVPPEAIISRLKYFENSGIVKKYDNGDEWFWQMSSE